MMLEKSQGQKTSSEKLAIQLKDITFGRKV
jgi:hypothetical protein